MSDNRPDLKPLDIIKSERLLEALSRETYAAMALEEFFVLHGRRTFKPDIAELRCRVWTERGGRQRFARAIAVLHAGGFIRWLPGDRYEITTRDLMTVEEYDRAFPDARWQAGVSWSDGRPE